MHQPYIRFLTGIVLACLILLLFLLIVGCGTQEPEPRPVAYIDHVRAAFESDGVDVSDVNDLTLEGLLISICGSAKEAVDFEHFLEIQIEARPDEVTDYELSSFVTNALWFYCPEEGARFGLGDFTA